MKPRNIKLHYRSFPLKVCWDVRRNSHYCVQIMSMDQRFHWLHLKITLLLHHLHWRKRLSWSTSREKKLISVIEHFAFVLVSWNSPFSFVSVELFSFLLLFLLMFRILLQKLSILIYILITRFALANIFIHQAASPTYR